MLIDLIENFFSLPILPPRSTEDLLLDNPASSYWSFDYSNIKT